MVSGHSVTIVHGTVPARPPVVVEERLRLPERDVSKQVGQAGGVALDRLEEAPQRGFVGGDLRDRSLLARSRAEADEKLA